MTMHKILVVAAMLAVSGSAFAGKGTTPGGGTGTGGVISAQDALNALFGGGLFQAGINPALFGRVASLEGAVIIDGGNAVISPPIKVGDKEIKITVNRAGEITNVIDL